MQPGETGEKDVVIQDNYIADRIFGVKSSSRIRDDDRLHAEKFEHSNRIGNFLDRVTLIIAF